MTSVKTDELHVVFTFTQAQTSAFHLLKSLCDGRDIKYLVGCTKVGEMTVTISRSMHEIILRAVDEASIASGMLSRMLR